MGLGLRTGTPPLERSGVGGANPMMAEAFRLVREKNLREAAEAARREEHLRDLESGLDFSPGQ